MPQDPDNKELFPASTNQEMSLPPAPETVTLELAAAYLDCSVPTVRRLVSKGRLEGHGTRSVCMKSIGEYLRSGGVRSYGRPRARHVMSDNKCKGKVLSLEVINNLVEGKIVDIHCEDIGHVQHVVDTGGGYKMVVVEMLGDKAVLLIQTKDGVVVPMRLEIIDNFTAKGQSHVD